MTRNFIIISEAGPADRQIRDFIAANDNDFYPPIAARKDLSDFVQTVYDHKGKFVLALTDDKIVGLTSVFLNHPSFITYYHYVAVDRASRHHGVGTALYNHVHDICRAHGVQRAIVKTWSTNLVSQAMFAKHGFFHIDTIEDDRSKGVHTFFFAKYFPDVPIPGPVTKLLIAANCDSYTLGRFIATLSSLPRTHNRGHAATPYNIYTGTDEGSIHAAAIGCSHVLRLCSGPDAPASEKRAGITEIDLAGCISGLVNTRNKKTMLISPEPHDAHRFFNFSNIQIPGQSDLVRIRKIAADIKAGRVAPAYYRQDMARIALLNDCNALVLGSPEFHTMFGFDKMYNGIEIFDPWVEFCLMLQAQKVHNTTLMTPAETIH